MGRYNIIFWSSKAYFWLPVGFDYPREMRTKRCEFCVRIFRFFSLKLQYIIIIYYYCYHNERRQVPARGVLRFCYDFFSTLLLFYFFPPPYVYFIFSPFSLSLSVSLTSSSWLIIHFCVTFRARPLTTWPDKRSLFSHISQLNTQTRRALESIFLHRRVQCDSTRMRFVLGKN